MSAWAVVVGPAVVGGPAVVAGVLAPAVVTGPEPPAVVVTGAAVVGAAAVRRRGRVAVVLPLSMIDFLSELHAASSAAATSTTAIRERRISPSPPRR